MPNSIENKIALVTAVINNTAIVRDIAGDQMGVLGGEPFYVVTNPTDVAKAILVALGLTARDSTAP